MSVCQSCGAALVADTRLCESCGPTIELGTNVFASAVEIPSGAAVVSPSGETGSKTLDTNLAAALAYLAGFVTGIAFLVLNPYKSNSFVRFHAFQSILFNVCVF
jgi:hypothetical protein